MSEMPGGGAMNPLPMRCGASSTPLKHLQDPLTLKFLRQAVAPDGLTSDGFEIIYYLSEKGYKLVQRL
jgi:hypothetical protein